MAVLFWAPLRGLRVVQRDAAKGVGSEEVAEGQLNAGRILDRSRSSNDSTQDFSEHLFGSSRGVVALLDCMWQHLVSPGKKQSPMRRPSASQ